MNNNSNVYSWVWLLINDDFSNMQISVLLLLHSQMFSHGERKIVTILNEHFSVCSCKRVIFLGERKLLVVSSSALRTDWIVIGDYILSLQQTYPSTPNVLLNWMIGVQTKATKTRRNLRNTASGTAAGCLEVVDNY